MSSKESFWAKVMFREYLSHYIELSDEDIVQDVKRSIVALTKLDSGNGSFGAKMVKWANERIDGYANSAANGVKGGRPRKTEASPKPNYHHPVIPPPYDRNEVLNFASENNIPDGYAIDWFEQNSSRNWHAKDGKRILNWKGALKNYAEAERKRGR